MKYPLILVMMAVAGMTAAQQPVMVKDINARPADYIGTSTAVNFLISAGDFVFFPRQPFANSNEWWVTDGTPAGTHAVGEGEQYVYEAGVLDGDFYFMAPGSDHSRLMKYTPGTKALQMVKEFNGGTGMYMIRSGDQLMFARSTPTETELWKTDGTPGGTVKFRTITPVQAVVNRANDGGTYTYFVTEGNDFVHQLWRTDGTDGGTTLLKSGGALFADYYQDLYVSGTDLNFFYIEYGVDNGALWKSDGTAGGTEKVKAFGQVTTFTTQEINGKLVFSTYGALYASDGTDAGTQPIMYKGVEWATIYKSFYYFVGYDLGLKQRFLGKSDGTMAGTSVVTVLGKEQIYAATPFHHLGDKLLVYLEVDGKGMELGITDGTAGGTTLLKDINEGPASSNISGWFPIGDRMLFVADDGIHGREIWITDGTTEGTVLVQDVRSGTADGYLNDYYSRPLGDKFVFTAYDTLNGTDLWLTDGTGIKTKKIYDSKGGGVYYVGTLGGFLYYSTDSKLIRVKSDATSEVVKAFTSFFGFDFSSNLQPATGKLYYRGYTSSTGDELWVTDGTSEGSHIVKDIREGPGSTFAGGNAEGASAASGKFVFVGDDGVHGRELWMSDGTEDGTQLLVDIEPGNDSSNPFFPIAFKNMVYFFADRISGTKQLWVTDGTAQGTKMVADLLLSTGGNIPSYAVILGNQMLFSFNQINEARQIWKSDGTTNGTGLLKSFGEFEDWADGIYSPVSVGDKAFFHVDDGEHGGELWATDGTEAGTKVIDLSEGSASTTVNSMKALHGLLYFNQPDALWRTGGTVQTTEKVAEGSTSSMNVVGEKVYLGLTTEEFGAELYVMPFTKINQDVLFNEISDKPEGGSDFTLSASATSGFPITFSSSPSDLVSITGNSVKMLKPGSVTITARQNGSDGVVSASQSHTICIIPSKPVITLKQDKGFSKILESSAAAGNQWNLNGAAIANATGTTYEVIADGNYTVSVKIDACASEASTAMAVTVVGLEDEAIVTVFPNPARDKLFVQWNRNVVHASIIDTKGSSRLNTSFIDNTELNISDFPPGFYLLRLTADEKQVFRKFIKE